MDASLFLKVHHFFPWNLMIVAVVYLQVPGSVAVMTLSLCFPLHMPSHMCGLGTVASPGMFFQVTYSHMTVPNTRTELNLSQGIYAFK